MRGLRSILLAAAGVVACTRPFELPQTVRRPIVEGMEPYAAFYLDPIVVRGRNFDDDAARNEVVFPGGFPVPGESISKDADGVQSLHVSVPLGTTQGHIVVQTPEGRSLPFGDCGPPATDQCFYYKGAGHPVNGTFVGDVRVVHRPPGIAVAGGDVFLASSLFRAVLPRSVLARGDPPILVAARPLSFAGTADGAALFVGYDYDDAGPSLIDTATLARVAEAAKTHVAARFASAALVGAGGPLAYSVGDDQDGATSVLAYTRSGNTLDAQKMTIPVIRAHGLAAVSGGQVAVTATWQDGGHVRGGVVLANPATTDAVVKLALEDGVLPSGPVARFELAGRETVALAADDGTLRLLDMQGAPAWNGAPVRLGTVTPVAGLIAVARTGQDPLLVVTRPLDGVVAAWDAGTGAAAWAVPFPNIPSVLTADAAGRVYVAHDDSNEVEVIDALTGRWEQRFVYDTGLGNPDECACGPVAPFDYIPDGQVLGTRRILFIARRLRHIVVLDPDTLALGRPIALKSPSPPIGLVKEFVGGDTEPYRIWVLHDAELAVLDGFQERVVAPALPAPPLAVLFAADGRVVVGAADRLDVYVRVEGGGGFTLVRTGGVALPAGSTLKLLDVRKEKDESGAVVGESIVALWTVDSSGGLTVDGGQWSVDALVAGQAAQSPFQAGAHIEASGFLGAVKLLTGPLLFYRNARVLPDGALFAPGAVRIQDDLTPFVDDPIFPSVVKEIGPTGGTTADGRYFFWTRRLLRDNILRVAYGAPGPAELEGFSVVDWSTYRLDAPFAPPTTDPSGEWLYVPVPGVDQISIFQ